jgi:Transposase DDE domain
LFHKIRRNKESRKWIMAESWGSREFKDSAVEDKREANSLAQMANRLLEHPELAFSSAVGNALRRAVWRIFSKEEVDISCGHYRQTASRCQEEQVVLVSQDTTDLSYPTHPATEGLGDLGGGNGGVNRGLCLHSALSAQGLPLGLVGQKLWAPVATGKSSHKRSAPLQTKESYRWVEALGWVGQYLSHIEQVVVISDSESDFYEYMAAPRAANVALLFRVHHLQRYVYYQQERMPLGEISFTNATNVPLLLPKTKKRKPRTAQLQVSWGQLVCPPACDKKGAELGLWLVKAIEVAPPAGQEPVEWYLLTTIEVMEEDTALLLLAYYRRRWVIERWHLVLKQGLQVERLQFDTFQRLLHAIALLSIVAWQLLWLKHLAEQSPELEAEQVFEPMQVQVLEQQTKKKKLSVKVALIAIAALAGFTPSKKQPLPGEKTIWRGWNIFSSMCQGYKLASQKSYGTG